jgi:hypothetical protein
MSRSMNGIKTLSDGISIISDGIAQHENVIYSEFINSEDGKTQMINNQLTTEIVECQNLNADDIMSLEINTDLLKTKNIKVIDSSGNEIFIGDGINKKFTFNGNTEFNEPLTIINDVLNQTQGGYIYQTGTNFNTLKDTKINGFLEVGSNFTQTGGSTSLKDLTVDNINMNTNKGITQSGTGISNTLGTSTITNLTITGSITFPSEVEIPGTTTSDDIIMNGSSVITQDTTNTTTKFNKFRYTKTLSLDVGGNLTMTEAGTNAILKNTTIQGTSLLQGDIEQTAGFTKLNTIECNNITLRTNNDLNISGTGKINQIGTGINALNAIVLNSNQNITFNGTGIISQPLNGTNILSHFRGAGFGIIGGRNNTTFSHYQNIQNNNGLQFQYNRDNTTFNSYFLNNRVGLGGGFRFQRYNGGVYVDEPLVIDDDITFNKDVSIVGKSISASSATLGIITQNELNCLDNCNINILTKFNNLDSQISSLQTTTGGVSTATTGISYNSGNDTTTIDNNLIVSSGKSLTLGSTNVNSFITDTNTFITASSNTLQGIVYTSGNDTTTINNNVSITGNLLVQGLDVKAEIDALETSFTTGTLTSTNLTTTNLNIAGQINMTNSTVSNRYIYGIGGLTFSDFIDDSYALNIYNAGGYHYFISQKNEAQFMFLGKNASGVFTDNRFQILPNASSNGVYNSTTKADDVLLLSSGGAVGNQSMNLTVWSDTATGVRIEPTKTTITGGNNKITVDNTDGVIIDGIQKINDSMRFYSGANYTELNQMSSDFTINNKSSNPKILMNINDENLIELNNTQVKVNTSFHIDNTAEFIPNFINETSFPKTLGTTNIFAGLMSVSEFKRQINVNIPISLYRQYRNITANAGFANIIEDTLNSVGYTIYKNGLFFGSGTCPTTDTTPKLIHIYSTSSTTSRNYEVYITNISFSFIPPFEKTSNVFTFYITPNYNIDVLLQADNLIVENFGYFTNTNISTSTYPLTAGTTPGLNYSSSSYSFTDYGLKYLTGLGSSKLNSVISNNIDNQFQIKTDSLVANSTTSTNISSTSINSSTIQTNNLYCPIDSTIKMNYGLAGYAIDGPPFLATPIFCSLRSYGRANTDNIYYLNPGYKVELFNGVDYVSFIALLDNTDNPTGNSFTLSDTQRDRTESIKVYFMNEEITFLNLS